MSSDTNPNDYQQIADWAHTMFFNLTRTKKLATPLAFMLVLLVTTACVSVSLGDEESGGGESSDQIFRQFNTSSTPMVNVTGFNGRITITADESNAVSVEANLKRPDRVSFEATVDGDVVNITARQIGAGVFIGSSPSAQMNLSVPSGSKIDARTSNGSIKVTGVHECMELQTSNGSIVVEDLSGCVDATTSNGSIALSGDLSEKSVNSLKTSNGSITVSFESEPDVAVDAQTSNGVVSTDIPILTSVMERTRLIGEYGSGSATLKAETSNGNVTFEQE